MKQAPKSALIAPFGGAITCRMGWNRRKVKGWAVWGIGTDTSIIGHRRYIGVKSLKKLEIGSIIPTMNNYNVSHTQGNIRELCHGDIRLSQEKRSSKG